MHLNTIEIVAWTFPLSLAKYHMSFPKMQDFPQKTYSLPLKGIRVCCMNLTYCIPVPNVILNTTMKPPMIAKNHLSSFCNIPFRKLDVCSTNNTPAKYGAILERMQRSFWKMAAFSQMIGNHPAPHVACFSAFSHCFSMHFLSKSAMHQHNIPWKSCKDDNIAYKWQLFYQTIWHSLGQRSHVSAK